jgi:hypothetical protein
MSPEEARDILKAHEVEIEQGNSGDGWLGDEQLLAYAGRGEDWMVVCRPWQRGPIGGLLTEAAGIVAGVWLELQRGSPGDPGGARLEGTETE